MTRIHQSILFTLLLAACATTPSYGKLILPAILSHDMVLQRNSEITFWGWADAGSHITIKAGWVAGRYETISNGDGKWWFVLRTPDAGGPYDILISGDGSEALLTGVLIGEVWLCSGQSNMEFSFRGLGGWKSYPQVRADIVEGKSDKLRVFTVNRDTSEAPKPDCRGSWIVPDTSIALDVSATAWYYGMELCRELGIPVGLVVSAWGGTPAEAWTPASVIENDAGLSFYRSNPNVSKWFPGTYSTLYNAMIHPLLNFRIRGAIWYQGESNVGDADRYTHLFTSMISGWREAWELGDFPFYFVQIAPYTYTAPFQGALLREAQFRSLKLVNTGMAVTMDIAGDVTDIHPKNKLDVGKRLALYALNQTYGVYSGEVSGPLFNHMEIIGRKLRLHFDHTGDGLVIRKNGKDPDFMIAGEERYFVPAKVKVEGRTLLVWSPLVKKPVAARYAFTNQATGCLFNSVGLPASSFRTDTTAIISCRVDIDPVIDLRRKAFGYTLSSLPGTEIRYTLNKSEPYSGSTLYRNDTLFLHGDYLLAARAFLGGKPSETVSSWRISAHKALGTQVTYKNSYSGRYSAGGVAALVDGLTGSTLFRDGRWQGFEGEDMDVILDLGEAKQIRSIALSFLADPRNWIFEPKHIEIRVSMDGINFKTLQRYDNFLMLAGSAPQEVSERIELKAQCFETVRYIRIYANNIGVCPAGHPGSGQKAWLFADEIIVN